MRPAVDIPSRADDSPRWWSVGVVGVVTFAVGLGLAAWGTDPARSSERSDDGAPTSATDAFDTAPEAVEAEASDPADPVETGRAVEPGGEAAADADEGAAAAAEPAEEAGDGPEATEGVADGPDDATEPALPTEGEPLPAPPADGPTGDPRVVPGQVAYLRCDGVANGRRCPRDEALEAAVWAAIGQITACDAPPTGPGWADLRLDFAGPAAPSVAWRDTFAPDIRRLNEARTMACLRDRLTQSRQSLAAERLLVSFRFQLR